MQGLFRWALVLVLATLGSSLAGRAGIAAELLEKARMFGLMQDSSAFYLLKSIRVADQESQTPVAREAHYLLGKFYLLKLNTQSAKYHFRKAAFLANKMDEPELQGFALDRLGFAYLDENQPDSALLCFQQSLVLYESNDFRHRRWSALQGISTVFQRRGNYQLSKKYGEDALISVQELDEPVAKTILLHHLLTISRDAQAYQDYAGYYDQYMQTIAPLDFAQKGVHQVAYFVTNENPQQRIIEIQNAISEFSKLPPTISLISCYYHLGNTYMEIQDWNNAINTWQEGLKINTNTIAGTTFRSALLLSLSQALRQSGRMEEALTAYEQYHAVVNTSTSNANQIRVEELQLKYESAQKEQTILAQQIALEKSKRQRNFLLGGGFLLVAVGIGFFLYQKRKIAFEKIIAAQNNRIKEQRIRELESANKLSALAGMIKGQEEERKRIAQELHDGLGGTLASLQMRFDQLVSSPDIDTHAAEQKMRSMLTETSSEVRRIARNMMPHALMKMGLAAALDDLVREIQSTTNIRATFAALNLVTSLEQQTEIMLYRIAQELCNNAIRHARPNKLLIQLSQNNETLSFVVEDDGTGFQPEIASSGIGLESVTSRVQFLNGTIDIISRKGIGTTVTIEIPLK